MEENKVAQKLKNVIWDEITGGQRCGCEGTADCVTRAILQSPDLKVEIVEPRYRIEKHTDSSYFYVWDEARHSRHASHMYRKDAGELLDWLNSRESK